MPLTDPDIDPFCPQCGEPTIPGTRFCRPCGCDLQADDEVTGAGQVVLLRLPDEPFIDVSGCLGKLGLGFLFLMLIGILIPSGTPHARPMAREKACYANMRVLLGAIEMYNMDHPVMLTTVDDGVIETLRRENYLKSQLSKPETACSYSSEGDLATDKGRITCAMHGTVE